MTLPASGSISFSQVNTELIRSASATLSLNDTSVRRLTQKLTPGSTVTLPEDFWGKAANFVVTLTTSSSGTPNYGFGNCQDSNGNLFVTGSTRNFGPVFREHFYIAKFDSNGVLLWQRGLYSSENDVGVAVVANAAGDVYAAGYSNGVNPSYYDIFVVKYNASGVLQWQRRYGNANRTLGATSIAIDASGSVYISGREVDPPPVSQNFVLFFKVDSAGTLQWARKYGNGSGDTVERMTVVNGSLFLCGSTTSGPRRIFAAKSDLSGNFQWLRRLDYGDTSNSFPYSLAVDAAENIFVAGSRDTSGGRDIGTLAKLNSSGDVVWNKAFQRDFLYMLSQTVTLTSTGDLFLTLRDDYQGGYVLRLSGSGGFVWENYINSEFRGSVTNINDSPCLAGYFNSDTFYTQTALLVLPNNGTGTGSYGGQIYYQTIGVPTYIYDLAASSVSFSLNPQTAGTTFSTGSMTEVVPTLTYNKYNI